MKPEARERLNRFTRSSEQFHSDAHSGKIKWPAEWDNRTNRKSRIVEKAGMGKKIKDVTFAILIGLIGGLAGGGVILSLLDAIKR